MNMVVLGAGPLEPGGGTTWVSLVTTSTGIVTVMVLGPPVGPQESHGRVTVVSGIVGITSVEQPQATVEQVEVVVQVVRPPAQVSQTST